MRAAAVGERHAGWLQLSHVRTADLSTDGCRSAASQTTILSHCPRVVNLLLLCCLYVYAFTVAGRSLKCPQHTDDQRRAVREHFLGANALSAV